MSNPPIQTPEDLVTPREAIRTGFIILALEKNRLATPYVAEARALQETARQVKTPSELISIEEIQKGLLTASGISEKALNHLEESHKSFAVKTLIKEHLEPAGEKFVEELVFRFLLNRGEKLGGTMRNFGGVLAQRRLSRMLIATLSLSGRTYYWQHTKQIWLKQPENDSGIELELTGLFWEHHGNPRTLLYNVKVPIVKSYVDLCLLNQHYDRIDLSDPHAYLALGELKGGIDPAGADEHWKTARTALERIERAFATHHAQPKLFFIGAAIEKRMAQEIWSYLQNGFLAFAANLHNDSQMASLVRWLSLI